MPVALKVLNAVRLAYASKVGVEGTVFVASGMAAGAQPFQSVDAYRPPLDHVPPGIHAQVPNGAHKASLRFDGVPRQEGSRGLAYAQLTVSVPQLLASTGATPLPFAWPLGQALALYLHRGTEGANAFVPHSNRAGDQIHGRPDQARLNKPLPPSLGVLVPADRPEGFSVLGAIEKFLKLPGMAQAPAMPQMLGGKQPYKVKPMDGFYVSTAKQVGAKIDRLLAPRGTHAPVSRVQQDRYLSPDALRELMGYELSLDGSERFALDLSDRYDGLVGGGASEKRGFEAKHVPPGILDIHLGSLDPNPLSPIPLDKPVSSETVIQVVLDRLAEPPMMVYITPKELSVAGINDLVELVNQSLATPGGQASGLHDAVWTALERNIGAVRAAHARGYRVLDISSGSARHSGQIRLMPKDIVEEVLSKVE